MAWVIDLNDKGSVMDREEATELWFVLSGYREGTIEQQKQCENIKRIFLNWRKAPDEYIKDNLETIIYFSKMDWLVDGKGNPTEPWEQKDWDFAKKWGFAPRQNNPQNDLDELK